jgi:predicted DCC family thiol-disulfide oxidoreductase YuxK
MLVFDPHDDHHDPRAPGGAWTGGQWSVARYVLGLWLALRLAAWLPGWRENFGASRAFAARFPWIFDEQARDTGPLLGVVPNVLDWVDAPAFGGALALLAVVAALLLAFGWRARIAALLLAYLMPCLAAHQPLLALPSTPWVVLVLLCLAAVPKAPFLSVDARKRLDPGGGFVVPKQTFHAMWLLLVLGSALALIDHLRDPAWRDGSAMVRLVDRPGALVAILARAGLAIPPALLRPFAWALMAAEVAICAVALKAKGPSRALGFGAVALTRAAVLVLGGGDRRDEALLMVQLFAFDPGWLRAAPPNPRAHLFFDGSCGMCHRFVRFVLAEDCRAHFLVSPLQGRTITELIDASTRAGLPDSLVLREPDGAVHVRSAAVVAVLARLGGLWRLAALVLEVVPRVLRDRGYDAVARVRRRWFKTPAGACPLLPPALRARFLE